MQPIARSLLVVAGLIVAQGVLAMAMSALGAARRSGLKDRASRGDRGAPAATRSGAPPPDLAAALRVAMTLLGSLAGVYAGAALLPDLGRAMGRDGPATAERDPLGIAGLALILAVVTLVAGDLIPRRLAMHRPEAVARVTSRPCRALAMLFGPVARALPAGTDRALRVVGIRPGPELPVSEEAIWDLMCEGARAGIFEPAEQEMVKRVLRLGDRRARAMMTPRHEIIWIDLADSPDEIRRKVIGSPHSRFPVCDQSLDNLLGIVHVKDLLGHGPDVAPFRIKGRLTLPAFLYEGTHGLRILEMLRASGTHHAIVLDEYGTVAGLLTLTDILQAIVGDIPDRSEDEEPRAARQPDGSWLLDGRLPLDEFRDLLDLPALPAGDYHTLAGLVVAHLGHIPAVGESVEGWGVRIRVVDMDGNRVDRLRVGRAGEAGEAV